MKISELIIYLQIVEKEHGDLNIKIPAHLNINYNSAPQYYDVDYLDFNIVILNEEKVLMQDV